MTGNTLINPFGSNEVSKKEYGVPVTPADEAELLVALGAVCKAEITAWSTADEHIG